MRALRRLALGLGWCLTALLAVLEARLAWLWLTLSLYVRRWGAEENPYAAEDAWMAGFCALVLLPLTAAALAWGVHRMISWRNKRANTREKR